MLSWDGTSDLIFVYRSVADNNFILLKISPESIEKGSKHDQTAPIKTDVATEFKIRLKTRKKRNWRVERKR